MTEPQLPVFDDPALKDALRDTLGGHKASALLRARVSQAVAAEPIDAPKKPAAPRWKHYLQLAAVITICVGAAVVINQWSPQMPWNKSVEQPAGYAQPAIVTAMADRHAAGAPNAAGEEALQSPLGQPTLLAEEASKHLARRVPVPTFAGTAFAIDGASYCKIAEFQAVRFHLIDATRAITIFSMPAQAWSYPTSDTYSVSVNGHTIAGYLKDGGLHCIIGDCAVSEADVNALVKQLRVQ